MNWTVFYNYFFIDIILKYIINDIYIYIYIIINTEQEEHNEMYVESNLSIVEEQEKLEQLEQLEQEDDYIQDIDDDEEAVS